MSFRSKSSNEIKTIFQGSSLHDSAKVYIDVGQLHVYCANPVFTLIDLSDKCMTPWVKPWTSTRSIIYSWLRVINPPLPPLFKFCPLKSKLVWPECTKSMKLKWKSYRSNDDSLKWSLYRFITWWIFFQVGEVEQIFDKWPPRPPPPLLPTTPPVTCSQHLCVLH